MRLSRIHIEESLAVGDRIKLDVPTNHYVRHVLRLKAGAELLLFDGSSESDFLAILTLQGKQAFVDIQSSQPVQRESSLHSEIIQGLSRSDHLDFTIQKCTELGVNQLTIFNAAHSQILLKPAQQRKRFAHWRAISIKACEQCGRTSIPKISFFDNLEQLLTAPNQRDCKLLLDFKGTDISTCLQKPGNKNNVSMLVGPEGGFSTEEIDLATQNDFIGVRLGPRVLRTETAAMVSLAILQSTWGDL